MLSYLITFWIGVMFGMFVMALLSISKKT